MPTRPSSRQNLTGLLLGGAFSLALLPALSPFPPSHAAETDFFPEFSTSEQHSAEEHLRLGVDFFLTDELEVAIDEFREAARRRPGYAEAYQNLGVALAKTGDLTGAIAAWSQAERLDVHMRSGRYHLSSLISYNYGIALMRDGHVRQAMEQWQTALRIQPDFVEARYALGLGFLEAGNSPAAAVHLQQAIEQAPEWPKAYEALGLAYYHMREFDPAEVAWRKVLALTTDFPHVHVYLGLLRFHEGNYQQAIQHYREALILQPELVAAHYNLGVALLSQGDDAASIDSFARTLALSPRFTSARLLLGVVRSRTGNWAKAAELWREALRDDPSAREGVWLQHNLGLAMTAMGNLEEAVRYFRAAAALRPEWAPEWAQLGSTLMATRQWEEAVEALTTAARLQPSWAHLHFAIGKAHAEQGQYPPAMTAFQRAVKLAPQLFDGWFHLGVVFRAVNKPGEAVDPLRRAAEGGVREAQSLLASMYANGSGVQRNVPLAMLWWFRSGRTAHDAGLRHTAMVQLSQLRRAFHGQLLSGDDRQDVLTGFELIRKDLQNTIPFQKEPSTPGHEGLFRQQSSPTGPVLDWMIEQALALDRDAQRQLHTWLTAEKNARGETDEDPIRTYFLQTAKEGNPYSCQVVRSAAFEPSSHSPSRWRVALKECPERPEISGY